MAVSIYYHGEIYTIRLTFGSTLNVLTLFSFLYFKINLHSLFTLHTKGTWISHP